MSNKNLRIVRKHRVGVCVPAMDTVQTVFAYDLARMMGRTVDLRGDDVELRIYFDRGSLLPQMRETLVEHALRDECTHVLFLDSDMRFPPETISHLIERDLPLVAANYVTRTPPFRPVAVGRVGDESSYVHTFEDSTGLERVEAVGFGVMMIQAELLRKIPQPRFAIGWDRQNVGYVGEDTYFCALARQAGFGPVIDHDLSKAVAHSGTFEYTMDAAIVSYQKKQEAPAEAAD